MNPRGAFCHTVILCVFAAMPIGCRNSKPRGAATGGEASAGTVGGAITGGGTADGGGPTSSSNSNNTHVGQVGGSGQHYTFVGRFDMTDPNAPRMSFLNSKIGAQFTGTSVAVSLGDTGNDLFNAVIDGAAPIIVAANPNALPQMYPISQTLAPGPHTIWLTKRTEPSQQDKIDPSRFTGTATFAGFVLGADGNFLSPPSPKTRLIEGLGDSGCTGYGVDQLVHGSADACLYSVLTQNADSSVFAFAARASGAELVNLSGSGKGIYDSQWDPNDLTNQLPALYQQTVAPSPMPTWPFTGYVPDVVVIDGGGDDLFGTPGSGALPDPAAFLGAYTRLLTGIRSHYPTALVVAALGAGTFGQDRVTLSTTIQQAIAARVAAGDTRVTLFDYFAGNPNGWSNYGDAGVTLLYGCEGHPSTAGSAFLGQQLAAFINSKMGW